MYIQQMLLKFTTQYFLAPKSYVNIRKLAILYARRYYAKNVFKRKNLL